MKLLRLTPPCLASVLTIRRPLNVEIRRMRAQANGAVMHRLGRDISPSQTMPPPPTLMALAVLVITVLGILSMHQSFNIFPLCLMLHPRGLTKQQLLELASLQPQAWPYRHCKTNAPIRFKYNTTCVADLSAALLDPLGDFSTYASPPANVADIRYMDTLPDESAVLPASPPANVEPAVLPLVQSLFTYSTSSNAQTQPLINTTNTHLGDAVLSRFVPPSAGTTINLRGAPSYFRAAASGSSQLFHSHAVEVRIRDNYLGIAGSRSCEFALDFVVEGFIPHAERRLFCLNPVSVLDGIGTQLIRQFGHGLLGM